MKGIYIILLSVAIMLMSCQKDDTNTVIKSYGDELPVKFSFSFDTQVNSSVDYQPMTTKAGNDEVKIKFSKYGGYRIYIVKEINGNWIVEQVNKLSYPGDAAYFEVKEGVTIPTFETQLRPGKYRLIIFTGNNAVDWNKDFEKVGAIVANSTNQGRHTYACTYKPGGIPELAGKLNINEEIFTAMQEFTVEKNEELTTPPKTNSYNLTLIRRVGKIRIVLKHVSYDGNDSTDVSGTKFITQYGNYQVINGNLEAVGEKPFCNGLDIWGEPWYNTGEPLRNLIYATYTTIKPDSSAAKIPYFIPKIGGRLHAVNYFTAPGDTVDVKLTNINVTANMNIPPFNLIVPASVKLTDNTISGFVAKPCGVFMMNIAENEDIIDLFGCYKEYN